jgi:hypothetical protein
VITTAKSNEHLAAAFHRTFLDIPFSVKEKAFYLVLITLKNLQ